jgi:hypothetical protein
MQIVKQTPIKVFLKIVGIAAFLALVFFAGQARGDGEKDAPVSFQFFHDQLASQGTWVEDKNYGNVWKPAESDPNWQPYTQGYWTNTSVGMTWVSDEPFGWATYHYGRWTDLHGDGWVWVPGYTWSPAWVSVRYGDPGIRGKSDVVGWAPLPPESEVGIDYPDNNSKDGYAGWDFHIGSDADHVYGIGPRSYHFVPVAYMGDHDSSRYYYNRDENADLVSHSRNITNLTFHSDGAGRFGQVSTDGSLVAALNVNARTPLERVQLTPVSQPERAGLQGDTLAVYAPRLDPPAVKTAQAARPDFVGRTLADIHGDNAQQNPAAQTFNPSRANSTGRSVPSYSSEGVASHYLFHSGAALTHFSAPAEEHAPGTFHSLAPASRSEASGGNFRGGSPASHSAGRASEGGGHASAAPVSAGGGHSGGAASH